MHRLSSGMGELKHRIDLQYMWENVILFVREDITSFVDFKSNAPDSVLFHYVIVYALLGDIEWTEVNTFLIMKLIVVVRSVRTGGKLVDSY